VCGTAVVEAGFSASTPEGVAGSSRAEGYALEVKDVRSRQLEGISFEVADLERDWLTFTSAAFTASVDAG
jgi:hypothetical protein